MLEGEGMRLHDAAGGAGVQCRRVRRPRRAGRSFGETQHALFHALWILREQVPAGNHCRRGLCRALLPGGNRHGDPHPHVSAALPIGRTAGLPEGEPGDIAPHGRRKGRPRAGLRTPGHWLRSRGPLRSEGISVWRRDREPHHGGRRNVLPGRLGEDSWPRPCGETLGTKEKAAEPPTGPSGGTVGPQRIFHPLFGGRQLPILRRR
mmetsp:Transcript_4389/g.12609  ORF Transcript_4389/g.12609 Transcript_4389/m.12609 type:complete len:206 (-) Transcript_4389:357-974(-)